MKITSLIASASWSFQSVTSVLTTRWRCGRRGFHLVETARAHSLQGEPVSVVHLLQRAYEASPETVRNGATTGCGPR